MCLSAKGAVPCVLCFLRCRFRSPEAESRSLCAVVLLLKNTAFGSRTAPNIAVAGDFCFFAPIKIKSAGSPPQKKRHKKGPRPTRTESFFFYCYSFMTVPGQNGKFSHLNAPLVHTSKSDGSRSSCFVHWRNPHKRFNGCFFLIYLWLVCHIRRTACKICLQSGGDLLACICVPLIVLIKP